MRRDYPFVIGGLYQVEDRAVNCFSTSAQHIPFRGEKKIPFVSYLSFVILADSSRQP
jgi:hypothetical protein